MTLEELAEKCKKQIELHAKMGFLSPAKITLQLPENKTRPKQRRIFRKRGPLGDVVQWGYSGFDVVMFDAQEVLDYISGVLGENNG